MSREHDEHDRPLDGLPEGGAEFAHPERLGSSLAPMLLDLDEEELPTKDEAANRFFAKSDEHGRLEVAAVFDERAHLKARFESPAFRSRQRYLMRYVAAAVTLSSAICVAAFVRASSGQESLASATPSTRAAAVTAPAIVAAPLPPIAAEPLAAAAPLTPVASAASAAAPVPAAPSSPAANPEVIAASPADAPHEIPARSAHEEKDIALHALERGEWKSAAAAAELSVQLDPKDGEAWLILGGADQQRGAEGRAHRAYASCAKLAAPGRSRSECVALAR